MKIILLHGDDFLRVRNRLRVFNEEAKKRNWSVVRYNLQGKFSLPELLSGESLFAGERMIIIDNVAGIPLKDLRWVFKNSDNLSGTLIFSSDSYLGKTILELFPKKSKIEEFRLPRTIFSFLNSVYPGNCPKALFLLHQLKNENPEFIFALLARQIRDLYWAKINASTLPYGQDWRILRIKAQADKFKKSQLSKLIARLAEADVKAKSTTASIIDLLDHILISQLE